MFRHRLTFLSIVLVLSLLIPLSGLLAQEEEPVFLRLDTWDDENAARRTQVILDEFMAKYPWITVENQPGGDQHHNRLLTMMVAGTAPDVVMVDSSFLPLYVEAGGLMDLTPFIEDPEVGFDPYEIYYPEVYETGMYQGKPYLLAKDYSTLAVYANAGLFETAGIPLPEEGWTFDDLLDIALQLTVDENGNNANSPDFDPDNVVQWGMDHRGGWTRFISSLLFAFGTSTLDEEAAQATGYLNGPEAVEAFTWMRDAIHEYHVAPTTNYIEAQSDAGGARQMFQDGKLAMWFGMGPWFLSALEETPDLDWAIVPFPAGPEGGRGSAVCWAGFGIYPDTEHPDEAWLLLRELGTEPGQLSYGEHALSSMPSVTGDKADHPFWGTFIEEAQYLQPIDDHKTMFYDRCVVQPMQDVVDQIFGEGGADADVQALLDDLAAETDECLAEANLMAFLASGEAVLDVTGMATERSWSIEELKTLSMEEVEVDEEGEITAYEGIPLNDLLLVLGVQDDASALVFTASDDYAVELSIEEIEACETCLFFIDEDNVLRLVLPDMDKSKWVKNIVSIEAK